MGFQFIRDSEPNGMGHNSPFSDYISQYIFVPGAIVSAAWTLIWGLTVVVKDNKRFHFRNVDVIYGVDRRRTALIEVIPSQW
jgi:hypothetical protein